MKNIKIFISCLVCLVILTGCKIHNHQWEEINVEATCTEKAYIVQKCMCGEEQIKEYIGEPLGHNLINGETIKKATCIERGIRVVKCTRCSYKEEKEIEKTNHSFVFSKEKEPTCQTLGQTSGEYCIFCGIIKEGMEEIPLVNHVNGINGCIWCNQIIGSEGLEYSFDEEKQAYILTGIGSCADIHLVVPEAYDGYPIYKIGKSAFNDNLNLKSVKFAENSKVEIIDEQAFMNCLNIEEIYLPNSLIEIGKSAFNKCASLKSIEIPENVKELPVGAFYVCIKLESVTLPKNLEKIGASAFEQCVELREITIPNTVTIIDYKAFRSTKVLKVTFEENSSLKEIGRFAFENSYLSSIIIPDSVEEIGSHAFTYCYIEKIHIGKNVKDIKESLRRFAFYEVYESAVKEFSVSPENPYYTCVDGVLYSKDGKELIYYPSLADTNEFVLPKEVESISPFAFNNPKITKFRAEEGSNLKYIYYDAFNDMENLKVIDLSEATRLEKVDDDAFDGVYKIEEIKLPLGFGSINLDN